MNNLEGNLFSSTPELYLIGPNAKLVSGMKLVQCPQLACNALIPCVQDDVGIGTEKMSDRSSPHVPAVRHAWVRSAVRSKEYGLRA